MIKKSVKIHPILIAAIFVLTAVPGFASFGKINDLGITLAVDTQLENNDGVPAHMIDIQTQDGVVTLGGLVNSWQEKQLCVKVRPDR
jgi:hypothetical protein